MYVLHVLFLFSSLKLLGSSGKLNIENVEIVISMLTVREKSCSGYNVKKKTGANNFGFSSI